MVNPKDAKKVIAQIALFQKNTLKPSKTPKGIRLNNAINELITAP